MRTLSFVALLAFGVPCLGQTVKKVPEEGCATCDVVSIDRQAKASLTIRWKRLVDRGGKTDSLFATAEAAVDQAYASLKASLTPLGVEVVLQKAAVPPERFGKNPLGSNCFWINGAALASYLPKAKVGQVRDAKSGASFRTIEFAGVVYRDVPARLIVQAGLLAAADAIKQVLADAQALAAAGGGKSKPADAEAEGPT